MTVPTERPTATASAAPSTAAPLRVGVVGLGWAGQQHLAAYAAMPDVEVVALAGMETEVGMKLAAEYGVPHLFERWEDLVALEGPGFDRLDAISVAVPTFLHAPITIAALERGIHVLSEKPMARTGDEAQAMVDAARAAGRVLEVVFNQRRRGDVRALHDLVAGGELGRPYHARASWMRRRGIPRLGSWFTNREASGGGPLADLGVHVLDYALYVLGQPDVLSVSAATYAELGPRGLGGPAGTPPLAAGATPPSYEVEDFASVFLRLSGGATLVLETSWAVFRGEDDLMDISVLATDGGAELSIVGATATEVGDLTVYRDVDGVGADETPVAEPGRGHGEVVEEFVATVREPATWGDHDGAHALQLARVLDAAYRSAEEGREVRLDESA